MKKEEALATEIVRQLSRFAASLVHADGGELYLVAATAKDVHVHLGGTCAGCPGSDLTRSSLIGPLLAKVAPDACLRLTTGGKIPDGARRVTPATEDA